ncbi:RHS repeat-associated core domain-containing protein [Pseudomonas fluorescens]|uniref:RHS repeat domain-containing protein n=1 Tax=Pseudomonas fluorescens TaxID=294 RepID=UPI0017849A0D|nr:RHS repeat-associated core domain-containing protein [Pseudomonas fluorescens]MBD8096036.1 RHS repeat-associated core domain-containing protein [Pseudomonas fluorescens]MBD8772471.1 RHS repeat-associated core domain-containing protein [Pseudomonas fluorescens]MBD8795046.1 RHS repeat-associated core domain-containing protein [Pseudomonas fluorescens]
MNVYSNAFNFSSYLGGSVDPRTGQYGFQIHLATVYPQGPLEVSRKIALSFSMMSLESGVYGTGWRISNTEFDIARSRLTLLSGEQFSTQSLPAVGGTLVIKDCKLQDLVVKRPDATTLHVIYKDGTVEVLQRTSSTVPYRIVAIQFENGERLKWEYPDGGSLARILDHNQQVLLSLTYANGRLSMVDTRVDGGRYARMRFTYSNARLTGVTAPYDSTKPPASAGYVLEYTSAFRNGMIAIERVRPPMGGDELINYAENGHQYANGQHIPRVTSWVQTPAASQPCMSRTYNYSPGRNFTGYPFSGGFREGEDNLYLIGSAYDYWTEETHLDNTTSKPLSVTRTTYNKFHLLTEEQVLREGTRTTRTIEYNVCPGLFPAQPPNLQLPKVITTCYALVAGGAKRMVKVEIETDCYGNELSRTENSGVRTEYSYYPIKGEPGKCPADPHELFQRYLKQERLIPAGGTPTARLTEYTHTAVPSTDGRYFVLQQSISQAGIVSLQQTYYEAPVELAGRLRSTPSIIDGLSLASHFSYTINGDTLSETRRLQAREGQWLESVRTLSLVNRRLLSMTRDAGITLALAYDVSGRLIAETASPGEPQQAVRRYAYHFATQGQGAHLITTDAQGDRVITYYDGLGRQVAEAQIMSDDQERPTRNWRYDAQGRTVEVVSIDYLPDGPRFLKTTHTYNRWGNASRVVRADGSVEVDEYDPYLNLKIEGVEGGERLKICFNEHNQPIETERLDADDNRVEVESRTYDGLGRCLSVLDIDKNLTQFTYDPHNRLLTTLQTPADGTPQRLRTNEYAPGTSSEEVSALLVDGKRLGARTFDSLGRMTSQARGTGQAVTWEYEADWMEPVAMVSAQGARQELTYDKHLDVLCRSEVAALAVRNYQYDLTSGALTRSETGGLIHEVFHDAYGYPEKEVQTANGSVATSVYGHSPGGRLLHQTSADGQRSQLCYDAQGRFQRMTTGNLVIEQDYDAFGRPRTLTTTHENMQVITRVSYDSQGRETERRFEQNGASLQVMTSTYHPNSMLATRFLRDANAQLVIGETFTYDAYLRLTAYRCEGLEHPKDHRGRGIVGQDFSFDSLNNITQVVTSFADGTQDTCERFFTGTDPTQLTRVTHTHPVQDFTLAYDAAGNLLTGPSGQVYRFNALEQLVEVQAGPFTYSYQYDADARQVLARRAEERPVMLAYSGERLETLVEGDRKVRYHVAEDQVVARSGGVYGPQLHVTDASGSVRGVSAPGQVHVRRHYTPYGDAHINLNDGKARTMADLQLLAFNGQRLDAAVNLYFLGNGQRAYDPDLMIFLQADPLSPFDEGGINGYAYCAGNPVNMMDPSGLLPNWLQWVLTGAALALAVVSLGSSVVGIAAVGLAAATALQISAAATAALGIVGGAFGTAGLAVAAVDHANGWDRSSLVKKLQWASFGFLIASWATTGVSALKAATDAYKAAKIASAAGKLAMRPMNYGTPAMSAALRSATRLVLGRTFKFGTAKAPTSFSKAFGTTRGLLRLTNLVRSSKGRYDAVDALLNESDDGASPRRHQEQPQPQPVLATLIDMPASASNYYQSSREEGRRVRQSILSEVYRG